MKIIKRNGQEVAFSQKKIGDAIRKANLSVPPGSRMDDLEIQLVEKRVVEAVINNPHTSNVEEIQEFVINELIRLGAAEVAKSYITYRYRHNVARELSDIEKACLTIIDCDNEEVKQENSNKNPTILSVQRDYMAGEVSKALTRHFLLPDDIVKAHEEGVIHFHDADYFAQPMTNCCLINLEDMLQNGTVISGTRIDPPKSFLTAATVTSQIISQVASNQYGGQTFTLTHLAPFVDVSRQKIRKELASSMDAAGIAYTDQQLEEFVESRVKREVEAGCQTIQYQLVTIMTTNGQAPFVTAFMYLNETDDPKLKTDLALLIETMLRQRIKGIKDANGTYITPAFPKLIYVLQKDNIEEGTPYFYLTELAAKCTAKRMVPDYISEKVMLELKNGDTYPCMGCRSFLTPDIEGLGPDGQHKYYGRFNQGVVTINLVDIALSSEGDDTTFWGIFEDRMENLVHKALRFRHEHLLGTVSDVAPILWQYGAYARLAPGETIDKLLYNNYSTISIGYAGLAECVYYMRKCSHTAEEGKKFGLQVMQFMNDKAAEWRAKENISYSVYGTPIESTTYKFAKCLQKRFGVVEGVTDKGYITNSYHIRVTEHIDAFSKLEKEAEFQKLSPGGAISYVEVPDMQGNIPAVLAIIRHIYEHIMYAELNSKSDCCEVCGYEGEIKIVEDEDKKLIWRCPNCGNTDQSKMHVARRTCGYIGTQFWNQGRTQEIKERVLHVGEHLLHQE